MEPAAPSPSTDGKWGSDGINKETGEYNPKYDTNGGKGYDIGDEHYDNYEEYTDASIRNLDEQYPGASVTKEELMEMFNSSLPQN